VHEDEPLELHAVGAAIEKPTRPLPPHGLQEIIQTFGDIYDYIQPGGALDPRWQADQLTSVALPFPIPLAWDPTRTVNRMTCHRRMVEVFASVLFQMKSSGLESHVSSFGGCFAFCQQRTGAKLSAHCWGIAIDLNSASNAQGTAGDMNAGLIEICRGAGFEWGGDWAGKIRDPMHFQFCSGY